MNDIDSVKDNAHRLVAATDGGDETIGALLLGGAAINLAIIANAVSKLVEKNPDPLAPVSLRDLSPEERETLEALRSGEFVVVSKDRAKGLTPS
jgi:hypothetical protein